MFNQANFPVFFPFYQPLMCGCQSCNRTVVDSRRMHMHLQVIFITSCVLISFMNRICKSMLLFASLVVDLLVEKFQTSRAHYSILSATGLSKCRLHVFHLNTLFNLFHVQAERQNMCAKLKKLVSTFALKCSLEPTFQVLFGCQLSRTSLTKFDHDCDDIWINS